MLKINALDRYSFEELCCQLAYEEFANLWKFTRINGSGWDWWVEAYITLSSWKVRWIQSKFFTKIDSSQKKQIENSFRTSKKNHLDLQKWILCLPIDLTDNIVKGKNQVKWARSRFEEFKQKNQEISIEEWFLLDINKLLIKYPNIDNAFFNPDPVKRKESKISDIDSNLKNKIQAEQKAKDQNKNIEKIFINAENHDIEWSRDKYLQYNLAKFRFIDYLEVWNDIEKIEKNINVKNLDRCVYHNFSTDFQTTISNYFHSDKPPIAELSPAYNYVFSNIGKQIWGVLSIGVDWRFSFHCKDNFYYMIIN